MDNIEIELTSPIIQNVNDVLTGPQGPQGEPGPAGADGVSPTITIGTTTTLDPDVPASVTNVGTDTNLILNFALPKGETGTPGADGTDGTDGTDGITPTVTIGTTTTLDPGSDATVTNTGTSTDVILNFGIPQGIQGSSANALSMPTVVSELPEDATPGIFYFVPKSYTTTTATGDSFNITVSDDAGRIDTFIINGVLEQATPPATIYVMTGVSTITIGGENYTLDLGNIELAEVDGQKDYIYNDGDVWKLHKVVGKIDSYSGETITTSYVSTSGTLTVGDTVYYLLDEAETTTIEDDTITNVLNMIMSIVFETGTTAVSITNADVTPDLEVTYHSYDPYNQYDKYVYMIETSHYEKIG